jgi:hypothetical protein
LPELDVAGVPDRLKPILGCFSEGTESDERLRPRFIVIPEVDLNPSKKIWLKGLGRGEIPVWASRQSPSCKMMIADGQRFGDKVMRKIFVAFWTISFLAGLTLAPKAVAQTIRIIAGPTTDDSYWIWNNEYQVWLWNGPEFQGDYQGHPYSYWHGRHEGGGDHNHRPGKGQSSGAEHLVNKESAEQAKGEQPRVEIDRSAEPLSQKEINKAKEQAPKSEAEKAKGGEKGKDGSPEQTEKKDGAKQKGE